MKLLSKTAAAIALCAVAFPALGATPPEGRRNFVTCPIVRDTKTVPCWLAESNGELYYLGYQGDFGSEFWPPYLGHKVLVEAEVSDAPRICGGLVLKSLKMSSLPEVDQNCNTILPAEDRYTIPFQTRGPGPNNRPSLRPAAAPRPAPPPAAAPEPPHERQFTVLYDFDNRMWSSRAGRPLQEAQAYAKSIKASAIEVAAYRGSVLLSDGTVLVEDKGAPKMRADQVREIFQEVGIADDIVKVSLNTEAPTPNGVDDYARRKVVITVRP